MLTPRQAEIIHLVGEGYQNREIAAVLDIDEETVKSHMRKILEALGARNRAHAVALVLKEKGGAP